MGSMHDKIGYFERKREQLRQGGGLQAIEKQHAQGKLTARERIDKLFDPGSFVELNIFTKSQATALGMDQKETPADGVIIGYGKINGRQSCIFASDFTVIAGTLGEAHSKKVGKIADWAAQMRVPLIGLFDSTGARLQEAEPLLRPWTEVFYKVASSSGVIPQIAAIMGPCAAGTGYGPSMMDFIFMVKGTSYMWLGGPRLTQAATSELRGDAELGGTEVVCQISGGADLAAENDDDCLEKIKKLLSFLPQNCDEMPPMLPITDDPDRVEEALAEILPPASDDPYNMYDIIHRLVDNKEFFEIKPEFAPNIIVGFCRFAGRSVGLIANQPEVLTGFIDVDASDKAARFIQFCDCFNIPIVILLDCPAFVVGKEHEYKGILRHGAKLVYTTCTSTVPKISIGIRKCYGASMFALGARTTGADFFFAWPSAEVTLMSPKSASAIVFHKEIAGSPNPIAKRREMEQLYRDTYINLENMAGNIRYDLVDDIIDPRCTRKIIIKALEFAAGKKMTLPAKKHGNPPM